MNAWEYHRRVRIQRSRAMYAALRRLWRQLGAGRRLVVLALNLRQAG